MSAQPSPEGECIFLVAVLWMGAEVPSQCLGDRGGFSSSPLGEAGERLAYTKLHIDI